MLPADIRSLPEPTIKAGITKRYPRFLPRSLHFKFKSILNPASRIADFFLKIVLLLGNVSETPTPTTCLKSTAVHLQFVRQYAPHLYRRTFLASKLRRKGNPQYASHLYCSTPPICTAVRPPFVRQYFWKNTGGWGHRNVSDLLFTTKSHDEEVAMTVLVVSVFLRCCLNGVGCK